MNTTKIPVVVITGGPHAGKTTVIEGLKCRFCTQVLIIPEAATELLNERTVPQKDGKWSPEWQAIFQSAVIKRQFALEEAAQVTARERGAKLIIADRAIMDGAAYTPGGVEKFCTLHDLNEYEVLSRYYRVIHLESLAASEPHKYGKTGNPARFESLKRAYELEKATREAWANYPWTDFISAKAGIDSKISEAAEKIEGILKGRH